MQLLSVIDTIRISETGWLLPPTIAQQWVALFLAEQGCDEFPDFREEKSHQNAQNGSEQFCGTVNFHSCYLVFFGLPFTGTVFFLPVGFAGALTAAFFTAGLLPLTGALEGGAV